MRLKIRQALIFCFLFSSEIASRISPRLGLTNIMKIKSSLIALAGLALSSFAQASISITGNPADGTGIFSINQDITFNISSSGSADLIVFKNFVLASDGTQTGIGLTGNFTFELNGVPTIASVYGISDNEAVQVADIAPVDGYFYFTGVGVKPGDTLTIKACSFAVPEIGAFNPDAVGDFDGEVFIADTYGVAHSTITQLDAVPEPSAFLMVGLGAVGVLVRRRGKA
jgi:hypothetical protein